MKDYKMLLTMLELHARWFTEKGDPEAAEDLTDAAAAIRELMERARKLDSLFEVASLFCRVDTCPKCKMFYPVGYICVSCGTDNSDHES